MDIRGCLEILEVGPDADAGQIAQAYRDLAAIWHPDRYGHNPRLQRRAEEKLKEINAAYAILKTHLSAGLPLCPCSEQPIPQPCTQAEAFSDVALSRDPFLLWTMGQRLLWWAAAGLVLAAGWHYWPWLEEHIQNAATVYEAPAEVPPPKAPRAGVIAEPVPPTPKSHESPRYVLLYLTDGTVIQTSVCWENENMLLYRKAGGVIGIEKAKVARIQRP